jgi:hypothetical protein
MGRKLPIFGNMASQDGLSDQHVKQTSEATEQDDFAWATILMWLKAS